MVQVNGTDSTVEIGVGVVDKKEFELVLNHIKKQSRQANLSRGGLRTGLKAGQQ